MKIKSNGIEIAVEDSAQTSNDPAHYQRPVVLLIAGMGMQLIDWPSDIYQSILKAGYRVVRFDNRDIGLSTHFDHMGTPNLLWAMVQSKLGWVPRAPYSLVDMTHDALGVLDALGIAKAHVVGFSMGSMITQRLALMAPERVLSLSCLMTSSGARYLPTPDLQVVFNLIKSPPLDDEAGAVNHYLKLLRLVGTPHTTQSIEDARAVVTANVRRALHPAGFVRQSLAILADVGRADLLPQIKQPALVVHGTADRLLPFACGQDVAKRIRGAQLVPVPGLGHDLAPEHAQAVCEALLDHLSMVQERLVTPS